MTQLTVRVTPNARQSTITGWTSDEKGRPILLIKLHAPPADGKANAELIRFIAETLDCPKGQVSLLRGTTSRQKTLQLPTAALARLSVK